MPADISFIDKDVLINGVSTQLIAGTLKQSGLTDSRIGEIIGYWYVGAIGGSRPLPFDLHTDVQPEDPDNTVTYARVFEHVDWTDGEDRVQAGATPEEAGLNARFHAIENEFDSVAAQFGHLGAGARELRADLAGVVRELSSKITALQNDLFDLRQEIQKSQPKTPGGLGVLGTVKVGDKSAYITQVDNTFQLVEFAGSTLGASVRDAGPIVKPSVFDPRTIAPDDVLTTVSGFEDVLSAPEVRDVVERPGATVADLRSAVGGAELPSGVSMASVLATMPADQPLSGVAGTAELLTDHVVNQLPPETTAKVKELSISDAAVRNGAADEIGGASAEAVGVSAGVTGALHGAGVDTTVVGLSGQTTASISTALAGAGVNVSNDVIRTTVAKSRIAGALGRLG